MRRQLKNVHMLSQDKISDTGGGTRSLDYRWMFLESYFRLSLLLYAWA